MQDLKLLQCYMIATIIFSVILQANAYNYYAAKEWCKINSVCDGTRQSPIVLKPPQNGYPNINKDLVFTNFKKDPSSVCITNTGHTVELKATWSGKPPCISGGPLKKKYLFGKITFLWADKSWTAGDGQIKDPKYCHKPPNLHMEMNMYFYREDYDSFEKAQQDKGGLAAFQIFLKEGEYQPENYFDILEKNVYKVRYQGKTADIPSFCLGRILADARPTLDFYEGSLVDPPCTESVTWFVYGSTFTVRDNLVNEFRKIQLAGGEKANLRPPQQINGREIKSCNTCNGEDE